MVNSFINKSIHYFIFSLLMLDTLIFTEKIFNAFEKGVAFSFYGIFLLLLIVLSGVFLLYLIKKNRIVSLSSFGLVLLINGIFFTVFNVHPLIYSTNFMFGILSIILFFKNDGLKKAHWISDVKGKGVACFFDKIIKETDRHLKRYSAVDVERFCEENNEFYIKKIERLSLNRETDNLLYIKKTQASFENEIKFHKSEITFLKSENEKLRDYIRVEQRNRQQEHDSFNQKMFSFFNDCNSASVIKKRYSKLSKAYHPDNECGCENVMKEINLQYKEALKRFL